MLKIIKKRKSSKLRLLASSNKNKPYSVVREDGTIIKYFENLYSASEFSTKLNIVYNKNGIKSRSKVIKLIV